MKIRKYSWSFYPLIQLELHLDIIQRDWSTVGGEDVLSSLTIIYET